MFIITFVLREGQFRWKAKVVHGNAIVAVDRAVRKLFGEHALFVRDYSKQGEIYGRIYDTVAKKVMSPLMYMEVIEPDRLTGDRYRLTPADFQLYHDRLLWAAEQAALEPFEWNGKVFK